MTAQDNACQKHDLGLVIDWEFHLAGRWVSIFAPNLVNAIIARFDPVIISSQQDYDLHASGLAAVVAMEPGWAAPPLRYSGKHPVAVMASDPHNKTDWFQRYVETHNVSHVLSQYLSPFFHHFPHFSRELFVHFPWAVADSYLRDDSILRREEGNEVHIFGASGSDAYNLRNWCRMQKGVLSHDNSGVELKQYSELDYFDWLHHLDAAIAAGSSKRKYRLVTPKYFEIAAAGTLLIGQDCPDLEPLGFNQTNMLPFGRWSFNRRLREYRQSPEKFLEHRLRGRELIRAQHTIGKRIEQLGTLLGISK